MQSPQNNPSDVPSANEIASALRIYLSLAYDGKVPATVSERFCPPSEDAGVETWLMTCVAERTPPNGAFEDVRSFALRLGNAAYPHMKLRLSRAPGDDALIFSVDSHDAMLKAPDGSPDAAALEELKAFNADLGGRINSAWGAAGLLTEHENLRRKIRQAKDSQD